MVLNALYSIRDLQYDNWHLAFIDDGSSSPGAPIVKRVLGEDKVTFYRIEDTKEQKLAQGGSQHPEYMNRAILESDLRDEDVVIILCDDDALMLNYLNQLNDFYLANPGAIMSYCHIRPYDPLVEHYNNPDIMGRAHGYNYSHPLNPCCVVDSSQVTYRKKVMTDGIRYPSPQSRALDAALYSQLAGRYGLCIPNNIVGQYKGWGSSQLSYRSGDAEFMPPDCEEF